MTHRSHFRLIPAVSLLWACAVSAVSGQDLRAPNMFRDVDQNHWAYQAVEGLRDRNIVSGYPDGYFKGKRTLTRYEFAVAIDRAVKLVSGGRRDANPMESTLQLDARDIETLRRLLKEFREELASLGREEKATGQLLDRLVHSLEATSRRAKASDNGAHTLAPGNPVTTGRLGASGAAGFGTLSTGDINSDSAGSVLRQFALSLTGAAGRSSQITLGRFSQTVGSVSLGKADELVDSSSLLQTGGSFVDGARLTTRVGGLKLQAFYGNLGSTDSLLDTLNVAGWRSLLFGASTGPQGFSLFGSPTGAVDFPGASAQKSRAVGVSGAVGFNVLEGTGRLRLSALTSGGLSSRDGRAVDDVVVLGANSDITLAKRLTLSAEWARSMVGSSRFSSTDPLETNAFNAMVGYNGAGLNVSAGYRYVDPLFYTPGYWGRIGNWLNPTNIRGPTFRAAYDLGPNVGFTVGGDYFTAARDGSALGLDSNEDIKRALLGVRLGLSRSLNLTADYEGVFWSLNGSRGAGTGMFHPTEHYITLGTGYNLTGSALLRFNYQIGDFDGHGSLNNGGGTRSKYNAFVGQVSVKF